MEDTIVAISTALGVGAISIIRVSGEDSIKIVNKVFEGKDLETVDTHTIHYGFIKEKETKIDEVLVSIMKAPKTFTKENVVEINCHGGLATTNKILEILLNNGCRLAEPGEFTKRAFLNGRIDLIEAESIMDIISSKTELTRKLAINGIEGKITNIVKNLRQKIVEVLANIEVNIDYPEYEDAVVMTNELLNKNVSEIKTELQEIILKSENTKLIKDGITIGIFGRPNVGKSSILNKLINEDKAIVTNIEGTTRDIVEGEFLLNGININLIDTAGIRNTNDVVEKIGVEKSNSLLNKVDLALIVLNNNEKLQEDDLNLLETTKDLQRIIVINKIDLNNNLKLEQIQDENIVYCNTVAEEGLNSLKNKIIELFNLGNIEEKDLTYLSNARSISILKECMNKISDIENALLLDVPVDIIEIDLKAIWDLLGEIIGETYQDELLDQLFTQFCLGK